MTSTGGIVVLFISISRSTRALTTISQQPQRGPSGIFGKRNGKFSTRPIAVVFLQRAGLGTGLGLGLVLWYVQF